MGAAECGGSRRRCKNKDIEPIAHSTMWYAQRDAEPVKLARGKRPPRWGKGGHQT